jgi:NAD(P)-dependent dehydrogenase (short-subunit alcohol dehydrogenase family)
MSTAQLITTPFSFESTAAEVAAAVDLSGKRAIVTGAASGIGVETARALAGAGAGVTLAVRDLDAGARVASDALVGSWEGPLHLLVNNAGVMALEQRELTPEGYEMQFATNHLGHFALALGLHDALAADGNARIVSVSSSGHLRSPIVFEDINFDFRPYEPFLAYGQSKTANVLFAVEATRRWAHDGITANALMPGGILTNLQRHTDPERMKRAREQSGGKIRFKTVEQGAATSVLLAVSPQLEGVGARYFEDCNEAQTLFKRGEGPFAMHGVAWWALDAAIAQRLWDESLLMLGRTLE